MYLIDAYVKYVSTVMSVDLPCCLHNVHIVVKTQCNAHSGSCTNSLV